MGFFLFRVWIFTGEDDEVRFLGGDDTRHEDGGVEVGAVSFLGGKNIETASSCAVCEVHIGNLENLELAVPTEPEFGTV